jgi:hypothetical protein
MKNLSNLLLGITSVGFIEWVGSVDWHLIIQTGVQVVIGIATIYHLFFKPSKQNISN